MYKRQNIIPEVAFQNIEILKEGATTAYGSDAVAGVVNFLTYKNFDGFKIRFGISPLKITTTKRQTLASYLVQKFLGSMLSLVSTN